MISANWSSFSSWKYSANDRGVSVEGDHFRRLPFSLLDASEVIGFSGYIIAFKQYAQRSIDPLSIQENYHSYA